MVAVGMLLVWVGYSLGLEGWCLFRDYDVTLGQLMSPTHPYAGPWPPAKIPDTQIWPGGTTAAGSTSTGAATIPGTQEVTPTGGACPPGYQLGPNNRCIPVVSGATAV
jgi:hypothetical protein